jgi:hypothetical protein
MMTAWADIVIEKRATIINDRRCFATLSLQPLKDGKVNLIIDCLHAMRHKISPYFRTKLAVSKGGENKFLHPYW